MQQNQVSLQTSLKKSPLRVKYFLKQETKGNMTRGSDVTSKVGSDFGHGAGLRDSLDREELEHHKRYSSSLLNPT